MSLIIILGYLNFCDECGLNNSMRRLAQLTVLPWVVSCLVFPTSIRSLACRWRHCGQVSPPLSLTHKHLPLSRGPTITPTDRVVQTGCRCRCHEAIYSYVPGSLCSITAAADWLWSMTKAWRHCGWLGGSLCWLIDRQVLSPANTGDRPAAIIISPQLNQQPRHCCSALITAIIIRFARSVIIVEWVIRYPCRAGRPRDLIYR